MAPHWEELALTDVPNDPSRASPSTPQREYLLANSKTRHLKQGDSLGYGTTEFVRSAVTAVLVACLFPASREWLNSGIASMWEAVLARRFFHWELCEAMVATMSFWVCGAFYEMLHLAFPSVLAHKIHHRASGAPLKNTPEQPRVITSAAFFLWTKVGGSLVYLGAILLYHKFIRVKPGLPLEPPTAVRLLTEVAVGVFLYDLCFTPIHWLMHNSSLRWVRKLHRVHHEMKGTLAAGATVHHSLVDGSLQVLVNILVQQVSPFGRKHILSRLIHNVVVTYLLTESHSGYDLPFMSHRVFPSLFGGSIRHNAHHNRGDIYYQQFFMYLDNAFGSVE